jgi:hypothetical protein
MGYIMKGLRVFCSAALVAGMLAPVGMANGRNPGSVLIYPVQRSGPVYLTIISVTNTNTQPTTPSDFGGAINLHYQYANSIKNTQDPAVNPDAPFLPLNCIIFNRFELLTPADHLSVVTSCHNAVSPGGQEGFLVISATDPADFGEAISFDYLIGSELVVNAAGGMYSINAIPFEAIPGRGLATDLNDNQELDFDNMEYEGIPDLLYIDSFVALAGSQLALLNLTGGPRDINTVQFTVWNDNEFALSSTRIFNCWFDQPLHLVSPLFAEEFLKNSTPHDPDELRLQCNKPGTVETGWALLDSVDVSTSGGLPVSDDGAILGSISTGPYTFLDGGHLLWESTVLQTNGVAFN